MQENEKLRKENEEVKRDIRKLMRTHTQIESHPKQQSNQDERLGMFYEDLLSR